MRIKIKRILISVAASLGLAMSLPMPVHAAAYVSQTNIGYGSTGQKADIYKPASGSGRTIVIMVHGGGFTEGDKSDMTLQSQYLASNNMSVMNMNYRLAPRYPFPAAFDDVREAIIYAKTNAASLRGDPNKVVLVGYSAGANLAMLAGLHPTVKVRSIVGVSGPYNLSTVTNATVNQQIAQYMGATPLGYGSPINLVGPSSPQVFMLHGSNDTFIDPLQTYLMAGAFDQYGIGRLVKIYTAGHELYYPVSPVYPQVSADILAYITAVTY